MLNGLVERKLMDLNKKIYEELRTKLNDNSFDHDQFSIYGFGFYIRNDYNFIGKRVIILQPLIQDPVMFAVVSDAMDRAYEEYLKLLNF